MSEAYSKYGAEGEVSCEILEMPKKGFLGLGSSPAKIKAVIDDGEDDVDIDSIISDMKAMKVETDRGGDGVAPVKNEKVEKKADKENIENNASVPKKEMQEPKKYASEKAPAPKKDAVKQNVPKKEQSIPAQKESDVPVVEKTEPVAKKASSPDDSKKRKYEPVTEVEMQFAVEFVETVLRDLEIDAKAVTVKDDEGAYVGINIEGENTGALIGHHGETLDAIQYLANLSASRRSPTPNREFLKITVDIENYREKREETLRALARRMAAKAVKYKRNFVLEPMNPYERRIIHSEIQNIENVDTHSVGSDENRKVVVTYEGADKVDRRNRPRRRRNGSNTNTANAEKDPFSPQSYGMIGDTDGIDNLD